MSLVSYDPRTSSDRWARLGNPMYKLILWRTLTSGLIWPIVKKALQPRDTFFQTLQPCLPHLLGFLSEQDIRSLSKTQHMGNRLIGAYSQLNAICSARAELNQTGIDELLKLAQEKYGPHTPIQLLARCKNLNKLRSSYSISDADLQLLPATLRSITLTNGSLRNPDFQKFIHLRELRITSKSLQNVNIEGLDNLTQLSIAESKSPTLEIRGGKSLISLEISQCECETIRKQPLPSLQTLKVMSCPKLAEETLDLRATPNLQTLHLFHCSKIENLSLRELPLRELLIRQLGIRTLDLRKQNDLEFFFCERCPDLTTVEISGLGLLKKINLTECPKLVDPDFTGLEQLEQIDLTSSTSLKNTRFEGLPKLIKVYLTACTSLDKPRFIELPKLQKIYLIACSKLTMPRLQGLPQLQFLDLKQSPLEGRELILFQNCQRQSYGIS